MPNIANFFNKGTFSVENLTTNPRVVPDEVFEFNFYVYDVLKGNSAKALTVDMYKVDGRNQTKITTSPNAFLVDCNTWQLSATIAVGEWDGSNPILLKFLIVDLQDIKHSVETYLTKE